MTTIVPGAIQRATTASGSAAAADGIANRLREAARSGDHTALRKAAEKFEGYFVQTMMREMREAGASEGGMFGGTEMETFSSLFDQEIAGRIAGGKGLGLANMIMESLEATYGVGASSSSPSVGAARLAHTPAAVFPEGRTGYSWPLPVSEPGRISSGYGGRRDPISGVHRDHHGLDIAAPRGTPILAMSAGTVVKAGRMGSYGNVVFIEHDDGVVTRYAHQDRVDVRVGDRVGAGEQIGTVGSTGRSRGEHLHLEVRVDGESVDPHAFLRETGS